ncbi:putative sterol regulatory element binding protein sre1 [Rosellinia necatrix]|uniref:Putative sterol regulatory element binding protein sre1 n=1 Tax=Rosellinia necatrix TaxID=77044 RepID=A0A1W2TJI8_ROSNE|nr:putative sterol regulatory element binding protein sre1 [Rosellinia necatrix]
MTDRPDASGLFGLDGSNSAYYQATTAAGGGNGEALNATSDDQQFFNDSSWPYQGTPPYDTYDANPFYHEGWEMNQQMPMQDGLPVPHSVPQPALCMNEPDPSSAYAMTTPVASPDTVQARPVVPQTTVVNPLSDEQRQRLQKIAMPSSIPYHSPRSEPSPDSAGIGKSSMSSSPEGMGDFGKTNARKRKSSAEEDDDDDDDAHQPVKKTAHNMIEKRYRTNLNDKIAALRDSVPSLRIMSKSARGEDTTEDREELHGLTPAHKLNKATVLSKATEYIRHLEKRNLRLMDDNAVMQQRIAAFEKLFMSGAMNVPGAISPHQQHAPPTPTIYPQESAAFAPSPMGTPGRNDAQGLIQVPDDMKRIIAAQHAAGQPYPVPQQAYRPNPALVRQQQIHQQQQQMQAGGWQSASPYYGKLMVGSLAGLMLLEAIRENEQSNDTPDGRGLFALPIHLLRFLTSSLNINFMGYSIQGARVIYSIKVVLLLCSLWWALLPSLVDSRPPDPKKSKQVLVAPKAVPSLACPIHVRRLAWLTAVQTVWVPRHNFFLEAAALGLKTVKLSLRNLIGVHGYQMITGLTEDEEIARVKAWEIALDAQLAGGDVEISKGRLTLTLLASATLPTTPLRLMLKALHVRVLLWELGLTGVQTGVQVVAAKLARSKWNEAKQLYLLASQLRRNGQELPDEDLPDHLAALLEQDCDEVLNPTIIQRAHNLAWNHVTENKAIGSIDGMATVIDDQAVRSPMDAVAAWWSTMTLQSVLTTSLLTSENEDNDAALHIEHEVSLAIRTAPIGSIAQQRALVARALLLDEKRSINIVAALQAIGPVTPVLTSSDDSDASNQEESSDPLKGPSASTELRTSLLCAMAIAHLQKYSPPDEPVDIYSVIDQIQPACQTGLLGYISAYKLMDRLAKHEFAAEVCASTLERLSGILRRSTGNECTLEPEIKHQIVRRCLSVTRGIVGMNFDTDTGYGSMSDPESDYGTLSDLEPEPDQEFESTDETASPVSCGCGA